MLEIRVREGGLEPPNLAAPDPKSGVSANSTTPARGTSSKSAAPSSHILGATSMPTEAKITPKATGSTS